MAYWIIQGRQYPYGTPATYVDHLGNQAGYSDHHGDFDVDYDSYLVEGKAEPECFADYDRCYAGDLSMLKIVYQNREHRSLIEYIEETVRRKPNLTHSEVAKAVNITPNVLTLVLNRIAQVSWVVALLEQAPPLPLPAAAKRRPEAIGEIPF